MKRSQFESYRSKVVALVKKKGIDAIGEYSSNVGVPLVYLYEFVGEATNDYDLREHCDFKVTMLRDYYKGLYNE